MPSAQDDFQFITMLPVPPQPKLEDIVPQDLVLLQLREQDSAGISQPYLLAIVEDDNHKDQNGKRTDPKELKIKFLLDARDSRHIS